MIVTVQSRVMMLVGCPPRQTLALHSFATAPITVYDFGLVLALGTGNDQSVSAIDSLAIPLGPFHSVLNEGRRFMDARSWDAHPSFDRRPVVSRANPIPWILSKPVRRVRAGR